MITVTPSTSSDVFRLLHSRAARACLLLVAFGSTAQAHPGHSLAEAGARHLLTSPYHVMVLACIGLTLWAVGSLVHRAVPRRLLQFSGAIAIAGAALLWGLRP